MNRDERPFLAFLDEMNLITILLPFSYPNGLSSEFTLSSGLQNIPLQIVETKTIDHFRKYSCHLDAEIFFGRTYWIKDENGVQTDLQIGAVIRSSQFDERYYYCGNDLGVTWKNDKTVFKLWAPTATKVKIKLRPQNSVYNEWIMMKREEKGVWAATVNRDLEEYRYSFFICVNLVWREAVDPYAQAVTANGELGVIINLKKTGKPNPSDTPFEHLLDAIIYETHIRDFTIHPSSGIKHKGLYLGAGEINAKGNDGQLTGLSYVKSLGVTHIEFLPFNDFAGVDEINSADEYNWGYNPVHYNVPEGSYSTESTNPYSRIYELKHLINQIHHEGLRVIMDVVYNHVYIREQSPLEKIVPGYFFRHDELGFPSNGTGVGNDLASERRMVRKFILDSIRFWIEEYDIDGFRFDLMGILDITTINEVRLLCDRLKPGILLLGEGWNMPTPLPYEEKASLLNQEKIPKIAQFNDFFRDSIKGSTFDLLDKGYALGNEFNYHAAKEAIAGSIGFLQNGIRMFNEPFQSVNYVECHDNHTLWDKLTFCYPKADETFLIRHHRLATCIVLLAQGVPFLHSGQEFLRTKNGIGNSYRSPDSINRLDWERKSKYMDNIRYIQGIIKIRKEFSCFRFRTAKEIKENMEVLGVPCPVIGYAYKNSLQVFQNVILLINPSCHSQMIRIPDGEWSVFADECYADLSPFRKIMGPNIEIEPVCLNILARN